MLLVQPLRRPFWHMKMLEVAALLAVLSKWSAGLILTKRKKRKKKLGDSGK